MAHPPMLCSSMSVEGWGGVELPLAGLTPGLSMRNTLSVDPPVLVALAADTPLLPVLLYSGYQDQRVRKKGVAQSWYILL